MSPITLAKKYKLQSLCIFCHFFDTKIQSVVNKKANTPVDKLKMGVDLDVERYSLAPEKKGTS